MMRSETLNLASIVLAACNKESKVDNKDVVESPVIANDLSNQKVTAFAEDGQGHVWIGTVNGLCLYTDQDKFKKNIKGIHRCSFDKLELKRECPLTT